MALNNRFDDTQAAQIIAAAQLLPQDSRDTFIRSVTGRLADINKPSNLDVTDAIEFVLNTRGVAAGSRLFFCDAAPATGGSYGQAFRRRRR